MYTPGPAISLRTWSCDLPQNEHFRWASNLGIEQKRRCGESVLAGAGQGPETRINGIPRFVSRP
jgi:hypothetical protein